jgi:alpha-glucosidase
MTNNMDISFEESDDPQARQTNESVYLQYSRDPVRTPFQWDATANAGFSTTTGKTWLPIHADYKTQNLVAQKAATKSTFKLYQKLLKLRKENHVLQSDGLITKAVSENVFGFMRTLAKHDTIAVLVNLGDKAEVSLETLMGDEFSKNTKAKILIVNNNSTLVEGQMIDDVKKIHLGQYDAVILEVSSATKMAVVSMLVMVCSLIKFIF